MIGAPQDSQSVFDQTIENKNRLFSNKRSDGTSGAERILDIQQKLFHKPKFTLDKTRPVFTIGSCFARNVEASLERRNIDCITSKAVYPADYYAIEGGEDRNGALNAYTPASMLATLRLPDRPDAMTAGVLDVGRGEYADMMLHGLRFLNPEELQECRAKLINTYRQLPDAGTVIVTLGFTESWYYRDFDLYVNRAPFGSQRLQRRASGFQFHNLSSAQVVAILEGILAEVFSKCSSETKVIMTVSPVPLGRSFSAHDVIIANDYSKATLLSAAVEIESRYDRVAYFPSYQYVTYRKREDAYQADGSHVKAEIVDEVIGSFVDKYFV